MSETPAQTDVQTPAAGSESHADGIPATPEGNGNGEPPKVNREARYRVERNEAREELAAANARVEAMQTREVEHYAAMHLADPKDLLALSGLELADLVDDDGFADPDKIRVAAAEVVATRPGLSTRSPAFDPSQGRGGAAPKSAEPSWNDLFKF